MPTPPDQIHSRHGAFAALNLTQDPQNDDVGLVVRPILSALTQSQLSSIVNSLNTLTTLVQTEDSPHVSGDEGIQSLAVRNDAGTALAGNGDYIPFTTDNLGRLWTNAFVNNLYDITQTEDAPHNSGDIGVMALAVRNDNNIVLTSADLDYTPIATDLAGRIKVVLPSNPFIRNDGASSSLPASNLNPSSGAVDQKGRLYIQGQKQHNDTWNLLDHPVIISGVEAISDDVKILEVNERGSGVGDKGVAMTGGTLRTTNTATDFHFRREEHATSEDHACVVTIHPDTVPMPITDLIFTQSFYNQGIRICTAPNTAFPLTNTPVSVKGIIIIARRDQANNNVGNVFIGFSNIAANNYKPLSPNDEFVINAPIGKGLTLNNIYVVAQTAGDGVCWMAVT